MTQDLSDLIDAANAIARDVYVARQTANRVLSTKMPVILVPGVMGSRLTFDGPPFKKNWDPDDAAGMLAWAALPAPVKVQLFESKGTVMNDVRPEGNPGVPDAFTEG